LLCQKVLLYARALSELRAVEICGLVVSLLALLYTPSIDLSEPNEFRIKKASPSCDAGWPWQ
jgi:hypothetical protein